jgi:hypothetical protein
VELVIQDPNKQGVGLILVGSSKFAIDAFVVHVWFISFFFVLIMIVMIVFTSFVYLRGIF